MPSRRAFLMAAGLGATASLAGCFAVTGPAGTAATFRGDLPDVPEAEVAPVVARSETNSGEPGCPEGSVHAYARVHELTRRKEEIELLLATQYNVFTGSSQCSSDWGHAGITVTHDWGAHLLADGGGVTGTQSNVVPTGDERRKQATLAAEGTMTTGEWSVRLASPSKSSTTYRFVTTITKADAPSEGDVLAATHSETRVRNGWLGGRDQLDTGMALTYGDTGE